MIVGRDQKFIIILRDDKSARRAFHFNCLRFSEEGLNFLNTLLGNRYDRRHNRFDNSGYINGCDHCVRCIGRLQLSIFLLLLSLRRLCLQNSICFRLCEGKTCLLVIRQHRRSCLSDYERSHKYCTCDPCCYPVPVLHLENPFLKQYDCVLLPLINSLVTE